MKIYQVDAFADQPFEVTAPAELVEALDIKPIYIGKSIFDYLVEAENEEQVKDLKPDFTRVVGDRVLIAGQAVTVLEGNLV